jgi:hypothetical protein
VGLAGTPLVVTRDILATHRLSEIYTLLKGTGAVAPQSLIDAETRGGSDKSATPPPATGPAGQTLPQFFTASEASWFQSTFCLTNWQCLLYVSWLQTNGGSHSGRGYQINAMHGSEATANRTVEMDWWNGSSWAYLNSISMCPGCTANIVAGNTGPSNCNDGNWFFKSEILDNGDGTHATVDLASHVYSKGGGSTSSVCTYNCTTRNMCSWSCGPDGHFCGERCSCSGFPQPTGTLFASDIPICADDSCCQPQ